MGLFGSNGIPLGTNWNPVVVTETIKQLDSFNQLKIVSAHNLADYSNKYGISSDLYGQRITSGSIVHVPSQSAIRLTVSGTSGAESLLRTNEYFKCQIGHDLVVEMSLYHQDAGVANQIRQWGLFDDNNGVFFELSGTTLSLVGRSSVTGTPVDTKYTQAEWTYDKMLGDGKSGILLDVTKVNHYEIQLPCVGAGNIKAYIDGKLITEIQNVNTLSVPYVTTYQLPMSWRVYNQNTSTNSGFTYICSDVHVVGGNQGSSQYSFGAYNTTDKPVTTTELPLLTIRPKLLFNGIVNRTMVLPVLMSVYSETDRAAFRVIMNANLVSSSFNSVDDASAVEYDTSATSFSGGYNAIRVFVPAANSKEINLQQFFGEVGRNIHLDAFGTVQPSLTIVGVNEATGTTNMRTSITWLEEQ